MAKNIIMPMLGMTQDTGIINKWHKKEGDKIGADEILFEVETDKTTMEIEAGSDGYVNKILFQEGETVPVGDTIAIISETFEEQSDVKSSNKEVNKPEANHDKNVESVSIQPLISKEDEIEKNQFPPKHSPNPENKNVLASPKAKSAAKNQGWDLKKISLLPGAPIPLHYEDIISFGPKINNSPISVLSISSMISSSGINKLVNELNSREINISEILSLIASRSLSNNSKNSKCFIEVTKINNSEIDRCHYDIDLLKGLNQFNNKLESPTRNIEMKVIDLTNSNFMSWSRNDQDIGLEIVLSKSNEYYLLTFVFRSEDYNEEDAFKISKEITKVFEQPILQLL